MQPKLDVIRQMNRRLIEDTMAIVPCILIFIIMFVGMAILFVIVLFMLPTITSALSQMCMWLTIPLVLIVVIAILAKKFLAKGGK